MIAKERSETPVRSFFSRISTARLLPGQVVALAGSALILLGTLLLMLPISTNPGVDLNLLDALFTATSAVCVTGLIVMDTPQDFSMFGQIVILLLIQIGGLGYALMATLILLVLGQRIGLRDRMMLAETLSTLDMQGIVRFVKLVVLITFSLEGLGAVLLTIRFSNDMNFGAAVYSGIFHSISAFNNAGFTLFSNSLGSYQVDLSINLIVTTLVILGSMGFLVFEDIINNLRGTSFRFQTHTKLVVITTGLLILAGTAGIAILEWANPASFQDLRTGERVLVSYFHAVSRTAGFTTMDLGSMRDASLYYLILFMAIGGSPGSMSGGIKTTTFAIVALTLWAIIHRREDIEIFHRRIAQDLIIRAFCLTILALAMITLVTLFLAFSEELPFLSLMFEVTSAMGIVGLSLGDGGSRSLSALFTNFGKVMIIMSMLIGRFGPLMIGLFTLKTTAPRRYRYPESRVVIG